MHNVEFMALINVAHSFRVHTAEVLQIGSHRHTAPFTPLIVSYNKKYSIA